jgi:hypothetical protein
MTSVMSLNARTENWTARSRRALSRVADCFLAARMSVSVSGLIGVPTARLPVPERCTTPGLTGLPRHAPQQGQGLLEHLVGVPPCRRVRWGVLLNLRRVDSRSTQLAFISRSRMCGFVGISESLLRSVTKMVTSSKVVVVVWN